jgi:para-aminobenzoate synthetase/4-amino-4-deoxychorismate lyase
MIVDMVRNDLGRISSVGSVHVPKLFQLERYPTVWQMTSTVTAQTAAPIGDIFSALFPPASITGAPKARTTEIITEVESTPRGVYTGCIGYIAPARRALFNVAIRTALLDLEARTIEYGVGGGIVWDSTSQAEYEECLLKARIVTDAPPQFALLETLLWEPHSGYFLLEEHLKRLADSSNYLGARVDVAAVRERLAALARGFGSQPQRVRLVVEHDGVIACEAAVLEVPAQPVRLAIAAAPLDPANPFLYNKTTHRRMYDEAKASRPDCDDVVLWNHRGEATETTIANLVAEIDGRKVTPPVDCGLLPGVFRGWLLARGEVQERCIGLDELRRASRIWVVNSVRKWRDATLVD